MGDSDHQSRSQTIVPAVSLSVLGAVDETAERDIGKTQAAADSGELADGTSRKLRGARRGDVLGGRYLVEGTLGRGGMGRVLSVRHQVLGKSFALKLIKVRIADNERIRDMFYREGRLMSGLSHENICSIVDFGEDPTFGLFMVMELLDGRSLHAKLLHMGRFAPKVASDVVRQVADALRYIHRRGIVHGDIKSENILMIRTSDKRRVVKLLDFGLARAAKGEESEHVEGTPEYLAPERIAGGPASVKSDIYALGILFYELLVGRLPFKGKVDDVFRAHTKEPMPLPSEELGDAIDERADELIARATAKDPEDRHENISAFLYELRTFMNMMGIGRRGAADGPTLGTNRVQLAPKVRAGSEVFELAPIPLASVDSKGVIVNANRAFCDFLGISKLEPGFKLTDTAIAGVYPELHDDLEATASGATVKRRIVLSEGGGHVVDVAVLLTAPSMELIRASGDVHIALHPLVRRDADDKDFEDDYEAIVVAEGGDAGGDLWGDVDGSDGDSSQGEGDSGEGEDGVGRRVPT